DGDVPHEIAERERAQLVGPFQMVLRNAGGDAARALAHACVIVQELVEIEHDLILCQRDLPLRGDQARLLVLWYSVPSYRQSVRFRLAEPGGLPCAGCSQRSSFSCLRRRRSPSRRFLSARWTAGGRCLPSLH